jgi:RHS repeat-associated protein
MKISVTHSKPEGTRSQSGIILGLMACVLLGWCVPSSALDKSGVSPNVLSLPDGPGSIRGLGETFEPSLFTGTAKYGIGLTVPPAAGAAKPAISISYDSGEGNGPLGFGWDLNIPYIQRKTSKGVPRYIDADNSVDDDGDGAVDEPGEWDLFITDQPEDLVPQADGYYFCETEETFIRYRRVGDHWQGQSPDGTLLEFGLTTAARLTNQDGSRTFKWMLEKQTDTHGNTVVYSYRRYTEEHNQNQLYLDRVEYGSGPPPWDDKHIVVFSYETRPDWFESGRAGFIVQTAKRLKEIVVATQTAEIAGHMAMDVNEDGITDYLNRKYVLEYSTNAHWSLLSKVTLIGADGATEMPSMTFAYTQCNAAQTLSAASSRIASSNTPRALMDQEWVELIDLNGDGLSDILKTDPAGGYHTIFLNEGETELDNVFTLHWKSQEQVGGDSRVRAVNLANDSGNIAHLADMDGDGLSDLVYKAASDVYYFANQAGAGDTAWGERILMKGYPGHPMPLSPYEVDHVKTADIDGDKRIDIIQSVSVGGGAYYKVWQNLGDHTFSKAATVPHDFAFMLSNDGVNLADFNGDDLPDVVSINNAVLSVMAGLGYGHFAAPVTVAIPGSPIPGPLEDEVRLEDVTGNGLVDLVIDRAAPGELWFWPNLGNYSLGEKRIITAMPRPAGISPVIRWADMNGNGTSDLVYVDSSGNPRLQIVDIGRLMGCVPKPNLLISIDNGIGATTHITYTNSTRLAVRDAVAGNHWPDPMPFPMDVVTEIDVDDSLGGVLETTVTYHDGYYAPIRREFRGFARTDKWQAGDEAAPGLMSRYIFDVGRTQRALRGKIRRQTRETASGELFWMEDTQWDARLLMTGTDGKEVIMPQALRRTRQIIEQGQGDPKTLDVAFVYDEYGNILEHHNLGVVEEDDPGVLGDEAITVTQYAYNPELWLMRHPSRIELRDLEGNVITAQEIFYDDETFSGDNFGEVLRGDTTLVRKWIDPTIPTAHIDDTRTRYNSAGNPIAFLDALAVVNEGEIDDEAGHYRTVEYDPAFHTFPLKEIIHIGAEKEDLLYQASFDAGFGVMSSSTEFNGFKTEYRFDPLARLEEVVRPGDESEFPSIQYEYQSTLPFGDAGIINYVETRLLDSEPGSENDIDDHYFIARKYVDGLGRTLLTKTEAEPAADSTEPRVVVTGAGHFNKRGGTGDTLNDYFTAMPGDDLDTLLAYENIDDVNWAGEFYIDGDILSLALADAPATVDAYDALERKIRTTQPDGTFRETRIEPLLTSTFDENDTDVNSPFHETPLRAYADGLNRVFQVDEIVRLADDGMPVEDLQTWTTTFSYRTDGLLQTVTDAQNNLRSYGYDGLGRKISIQEPNRGSTALFYNNASQLVESIDAKGQRITYTYDGANRIRTEDYHDEGETFSAQRIYDPELSLSASNQPDVIYFYDTPAGLLNLGNGEQATMEGTKGYLAYVRDLSGGVHSSFDQKGRETVVVKEIFDPVTGHLTPFTTSIVYDRLDRMKEIAYPDGDRCLYEYNDRNLLARIVGGGTSNRDATPYIVAATQFTPSGQRHQYEYGNGLVAQYHYDQRNRLTNLQVNPHDDPLQSIIAYGYSFDNTSNITAIDDLRSESILPIGDRRRNTQIFAYDDLSRLLHVQYSFNSPSTAVRSDGQISYAYDRVGNMLAKSSSISHAERGFSVTHLGELHYGGEDGAWNRSAAAPGTGGPHALTHILDEGQEPRVLSYDANGNVVLADDMSGTWDYSDRLVMLQSSTMEAEYIYDHTGRRTVKKIWYRDSAGALPAVPSKTTLYIGKHFEIREAGQPTKYIYHDKTRVARVTGTLDSNAVRVQRFNLAAGWNLFCLVLDVPDAVIQLGIASETESTVAYRWNVEGGLYETIGAEDILARGDVFWLRADAPTQKEVVGAYSEPDSSALSFVNGLLAIPSLNALHVDRTLPEPVIPAWAYAYPSQVWGVLSGEGHEFLASLPDFMEPGQPVFINAENVTDLALPLPSQRIQYYIQDHLNSSNIITDAEGLVVKETTFYPFGQPRHRYKNNEAKDTVPNPYLFEEKELDEESNLHYFESRYLMASLGRFNRVDPAVNTVPPEVFKDPQMLNAYSFTRNNPVNFKDPDGQFTIKSGKKEFGSFKKARRDVNKTFGKNTPDYIRAEQTRFGQKGKQFKDALRTAKTGFQSDSPLAADVALEKLAGDLKELKGQKLSLEAFTEKVAGSVAYRDARIAGKQFGLFEQLKAGSMGKALKDLKVDPGELGSAAEEALKKLAELEAGEGGVQGEVDRRMAQVEKLNFSVDLNFLAKQADQFHKNYFEEQKDDSEEETQESDEDQQQDAEEDAAAPTE